MKEHPSPEEKLLGLIKGKSLKPKIASPVATVAGPSKPKVDLRGGLKDALGSFERVFFSGVGVKTVLWASFILACIYLIFSLLYPFFGLNKITLPKVDARLGSQIAQLEPKENKPFEYYAQAAQGKDLFGGVITQESSVAPERGSGELIKELNLMGVISGENPQAVIEDKKLQKSFTVAKGQFVGEFQVEDIQEGKVILNYQGQRFELFM